MGFIIAEADIVSALFLIIFLLSLCRKEEKKTQSQRLFFALTLSTMLGLFFDALSYYSDAFHPETAVQIILNFLAFSTIDICIALFAFYLLSMIRETEDVSFRFAIPVVLISAVNIAGILLGIVSGHFFRVTDRKLVYGPWRDFLLLMPLAGVFLLLFIIIMNLGNLGKRNTLALGSFVLLPIIAAFIMLIEPDLELSYVSNALACAIIFTFIRREEINEAHIREQIMNRVSVMDSLTGLLNRRGFNEAIEKAAGEKNLGVVFCDLNALKYMNDNFGHAAGDAYICRFADLLRKVYKDQGLICRISGDEFVVILRNISRDRFDELKKTLKSEIIENERIASAGFAYGDDETSMELITRAENEMYEDKNRYYIETGIDRRRNVMINMRKTNQQ